jgi:hypothetical protein
VEERIDVSDKKTDNEWDKTTRALVISFQTWTNSLKKLAPEDDQSEKITQSEQNWARTRKIPARSTQVFVLVLHSLYDVEIKSLFENLYARSDFPRFHRLQSPRKVERWIIRTLMSEYQSKQILQCSKNNARNSTVFQSKQLYHLESMKRRFVHFGVPAKSTNRFVYFFSVKWGYLGFLSSDRYDYCVTRISISTWNHPEIRLQILIGSSEELR